VIFCFPTVTNKPSRLFLFDKCPFPLKGILTENSHYQLSISNPSICNGASVAILSGLFFISKDRQTAENRLSFCN